MANDNSLEGKRIAFFIPAPIEGSGGIGEIFNRARAMTAAGAEVDMIVKDNVGKTGLELQAESMQFYGKHDFGVHLASQDTPGNYDLMIATAHDTPRMIQKLSPPAAMYLVQDYEAYFMPLGGNYILAENGYSLGYPPITLGNWLAWKLGNEFGLQSYVLPWAAEHKLYLRDIQEKLDKKVDEDDDEFSICFVFQPDKPRRAHEIGLDALRIVKRRWPKLKIYVYGNPHKPELDYDIDFLGLVRKETLIDLYQKCRLGLVISGTNPSRIPFEMMAAGLPVVDVYRQNNLFDYPTGTVSLAHCSPHSIAEAIFRLLEDQQDWKSRIQAGQDWISKRPLQLEHQVMLESVKDHLGGKDKLTDGTRFEPIYHEQPVVSSKDQTPYLKRYLQQMYDTGFSRTQNSRAVYGSIISSDSDHYEGGYAISLREAEKCSPNDVDAGFSLFEYNEGTGFRTHPFSDKQPTIGVVRGALIEGTDTVRATVSLNSTKARNPVRFSLAAIEEDQIFGKVEAYEKALLKDVVHRAMAWVDVEPGQEKVIEYKLGKPLGKNADLFLLASVKKGDSIDYAWADWSELVGFVKQD